jgi:hypothetical protein
VVAEEEPGQSALAVVGIAAAVAVTVAARARAVLSRGRKRGIVISEQG